MATRGEREREREREREGVFGKGRQKCFHLVRCYNYTRNKMIGANDWGNLLF